MNNSQKTQILNNKLKCNTYNFITSRPTPWANLVICIYINLRDQYLFLYYSHKFYKVVREIQ